MYTASKARGLEKTLFWTIFILQLAISANSFSLGELFGKEGSNKGQQTENVTSVDEYGSVIVKTLQALRYVEIAPEQAGLGAQNEISVPYGQNSVALVRRDGLNSLYVAFQDNEMGNSTENWAMNTTRVPFLQDVRFSSSKNLSARNLKF